MFIVISGTTYKCQGDYSYFRYCIYKTNKKQKKKKIEKHKHRLKTSTKLIKSVPLILS